MSTLQQLKTSSSLTVAPKFWRVTELPTGFYYLEYSYISDSLNYSFVITANKSIRRYKTLNLLLIDIKSLCLFPLVSFDFYVSLISDDCE